jgi:hypothetical protein
MQDKPLTVDECDEVAEALRERAASLSNGLERANLLKLAECFRECWQPGIAGCVPQRNSSSSTFRSKVSGAFSNSMQGL